MAVVQAFHPKLWAVAARPALPEGIRYAAQRLGELLDPKAHFAASATFTVDSVTVTEEFVELAQAFQLSGRMNPSFAVMTDAVKRTRDALLAERNLALWFPDQHRACIDALQLATDFGAASAAHLGKAVWLEQRVSEAARGPIREFRAVLAGPQTGYRARLTGKIHTSLLSDPASETEWRQFDDDLRHLAALLLGEGRDGPSTIRTLASRLTAARNSVEAADVVTGLLESPVQSYVVAVRLRGVKQASGAAAFGCRGARLGAGWTVDSAMKANRLLADFLRADLDSATLLTEVDAYDFAHASSIAVQRVERLADQYRVEHRAYRLEVDADTLVYRVAGGRVWSSRSSSRVLLRARARVNRRDPRIEQSLRYAALGTSEAAPVVATLHHWIALETLVRDPRAPARPYAFLMSHLSSLLALHAVRQSLAASWHVASRDGRRCSRRGQWRQIESWLGATGNNRNLPDLNRWLDLLAATAPAGHQIPAPLRPGASVTDAAALFSVVLPTFCPFARQTVTAWQWRLSISPRLANWSGEIEQRALGAIGRMYVMRNSTVHSALIDSPGAAQLAHAAANVVDTVYEVLPRWLRPTEAVWRSFVRVHQRSSHVRRTWGRHARPVKMNATQLTSPGGDGLSR